ncbi:hypothetical protein BaRGS_00008063 [Batillaria attramentaria]|uniref:3CxxC-type domain-containing protein n=1 Tax=Batillaria attramentaria TaxID=370345 RepID=A0ABD0LMZ1_9CAEN
MSRRRYGYFECDDCGRCWESAHVYCDEFDEAEYEQDCEECGAACLPDRVEPLICSECKLVDCICTDEDLEKKRNVDPDKPHMKELCHKCQSGDPCTE